MKTISQKKSTAHQHPAKDSGSSAEILLQFFDKDDATNRLLAKHPNAGVELLEKLSHSSDPATRKAVTSNPNTPTVVYVKLGQQFPKEFLTNPILDLLILESPDLLQEFTDNLLVQLLRRPECPEEFLLWAAGHSSEKVQLAVAMNAKAPLGALRTLGTSQHKKVRRTVDQTQSTEQIQDPEISFRDAVKNRLSSLELDEVQEAWSKKDIGLPQWPYLPFAFRMDISKVNVEEIAGDQRLPIEWLEKLSKSNDTYFKIAVVKNIKTPTSLLEALKNDEGFLVRIAVAKDQKTPPDILDFLAKDPQYSVRECVAKNPNTKHSILEYLAQDKSSSVRSALAQNPNLPQNIQDKLASDSDYTVRFHLALNHNTSQAVLSRLAKDKDVVAKVAANQNTEPMILESLAKDTDESVRTNLGKNPKASSAILGELAKDQSSSVRRAVAENRNTSSLVQKELAIDESRWVRTSLAKNSGTDHAVLEILVNDTEESVRSAVALNPSLSTALLEKLGKDKVDVVRSAVASNPNANASTLQALVLDAQKKVAWCAINNPNIPKSILLALSKHYKTKEVRLALATHPRTPIEVLNKLSKEDDVEIRTAAAGNTSLSLAHLKSMLHAGQSEAVLSALLLNPSSSLDLVTAIAKRLFDDEPRKSSWFVNASASAPKSVKQAIKDDDVFYFGEKNANTTVLSRRSTGVLLALCSNQQIDPSRIAKMAGSTDWLIRAAVARNTSMPPNLLKKLSADSHPLVSALATQRPINESSRSIK